MPRELLIGDVKITDSSDCFALLSIREEDCFPVLRFGDLVNAGREAGARGLVIDFSYEQPVPSGAKLGADDFAFMLKKANQAGMLMFATSRQLAAFPELRKLPFPGHYVHCCDLRNLILLRDLARFEKPILLNTGGAGMVDVWRAFEAITEVNVKLGVLQSSASPIFREEEANLRVITTYRDAFPDTVVGYSDRDDTVAIAVASYVLGARILERPFTLLRGPNTPRGWTPRTLKETMDQLSAIGQSLR